ncbi:MAG: permease-like cell division protein FtsX [Patescibacteria group bacterium]
MYIFWHRIFKSAWQSFRRNGWLSLVAVFIMAQALLIISILASLNVVIGTTITSINERIDVAVFFKETALEKDILELKSQVESWEDVRGVTYVSSQEAMDKFLTENRNRTIIRSIIPEEENFLPASLEIKASDPYKIEGIVEQIRNGQYAKVISETSLEDNQKIIEKLRNVSSFIQRSSLILAIVLVGVSLMIIFNTIRITIFTRRQEIEIMKLVGATDWYIRWPFIIEGMMYGVIASVLTSSLLALGYGAIIRPLMTNYLISTAGNPLFSGGFIAFLVGLQLGVGLVVGGLSSYWATRKHLAI